MKKIQISIVLAVSAVLSAAAANADLNGDGLVSRYDYALLAAAVAEGRYVASYDLDGNGELDTVDCNRLLDNANYQDAYVWNKTYTVNGVSFKMVGIEGGTYTMGAKGSDAYDSEPTHQVTLNDFMIGETEVTEALWTAVMGSDPSDSKKGDNYPVETVSWNDCQTFISKLYELTGETFRLPTEAEWEYAARGGNKSQGYMYAGSNTIGDVAWYVDNSGSAKHPVATKAPNELGLYDMSGNVWEWCQDWYGSYGSDAQTNPTGPASGSRRVFRGGDWLDYAWYCRVSYRNNRTPSSPYIRLGLRLAR